MQPTPVTAVETGGCAAAEPSASYSLVFTASWSPATHPTDYPSAAHFTPLVGLTHDSAFALWSEGGLATPGAQLVAERGDTSVISTEIAAAVTRGAGDASIHGPSLPSPGSLTLTFTAGKAHPLLSVMSMIGPSPDWFVGASAVRLCDAQGWKAALSIDLYPYDAGTRAAESFASPRTPVSPHVPITRLTGAPFTGADGKVAPMGTLGLTRIAL